MTDATINRLVAERVMGWVYEPGDPTFGRDWITHDGDRSRLRDWCTDPAAWAGLLTHLAPYWPRLVCHAANGTHWAVYLYDATSRVVGYADADSPGRALALAALRAYGVEG